MIKFQGENGLPDPGGQYIAALLVSALYVNDQQTINEIATYLGGTVATTVVDNRTVPPDYAIITGDGWRLVAFSGTTNKPQVLNYVFGSQAPVLATGVPSPDGKGCQVNYGFQDGLDLITVLLSRYLGNLAGTQVFVCGHSYGAAAAFLLSRRLKAAASPPSSVQLLTFGEPRGFMNQTPTLEVDWHGRIVSHRSPESGQMPELGFGPWDTVTLLPPEGTLYSFLNKALDWKLREVGITWKHFGEPYILEEESIRPGGPWRLASGLFLPLDIAFIAINSPFSALHFMAKSYLPWSQNIWFDSGQQPGLSQFDAFATDYITAGGEPAAFLDPIVPDAVINQSPITPLGDPVNAATRPLTTFIGVSVYTIPVPLAQYFFYPGATMPTIYKGTVEFNSVGWGGWSESVYSDVPSETSVSMMDKMTAWLGFRMKLSMGPDAVGCPNPVVPYAVRVEDELVFGTRYRSFVSPLRKRQFRAG